MWWSRQPKTRTRRLPAQRPVAEVMEPRILYSADIAAGLVLGADVQDTAQQRTLDANGEYVQAGVSATTATATASEPVAATTTSPVAVAYAASELHFEANVGQAAAAVDFLARGSGYDIALSHGSAQLSLTAGEAVQTITLTLAGAKTDAAADPQGLLAGKSNYLLGNDSAAWHTGIANYQSVVYHQVYDGVDVRYYGTQRQLEYDFIVAPGADAAQIRLAFTGVSSAGIAANGDLVLWLQGQVEAARFKAPVSYQDGPAGRLAVESAYRINEDGSIGFTLGQHDASRAVVIDPVLNYASYFGTSGTESGNSIAIGADGSVYITGRTTAALPNLVGPGGGPGDIYVAKFSADLSTLIYSTRIGGSGDEQGNAIAVDASGSASVTGWTKSNNFPTVSAAQGTMSGGQDAVIFRLNASGTALTFSTYLGGSSGGDTGNAIAVDTLGNVYAAGEATTAGLLGGLLGGGSDDAFIAKFNTAGVLQYGSLFGGSGTDMANGIAVDAAGNAYIVGSTKSADLLLVNAQLSSTGLDSQKAFLAEISADGANLLYSTYVGSNKPTTGVAIALGSTGRVYITGTTDAAGNNFQMTTGAFQTSTPGGTSGFVRIYDLNLSGAATLVYSSYLSADGDDVLPTGIAVDGQGRMVVTGQTKSVNFPVTADAVQPTSSGTSLFLTVINGAGAGNADLVYSTYYGSGVTAGSVAVSGSQVFVVGTTSTSGLATSGAYQTAPAGNTDALVAGFGFPNQAPVLNGANALGTILEDPVSNGGTLVSAILSGHVTDADATDPTGMAIIGADNSSGAWQYSLNGGSSWLAVGAPSAASALQLAADSLTRVRFVPSANFAGTVATGLTFRAWDRASGTTGTQANTSVNGGTTAFSSATASAAITVTPVNDAPVQTAGTINNLTVLEDAAATSLGLGALGYGPGGGADEASQTLSYTVSTVPAAGFGQIVLADGTTAVAAGSSYTLAQLQGMKFLATPNANGGPAAFSWTVTDSG
ncbi:MAG: SBBP repeat-containing protein, partial [Burkholderiaceae bacterium]|nr:SBBP repeat-containing protein [Burkholderiaceae bacterium]